jgi:lambda repressor-like predicted transcriptional regulator
MVKCNKNMKLNRIKAVLEEKGISQTWLSKKMGKSFSTVNAYVCNRTQLEKPRDFDPFGHAGLSPLVTI